jgi:two-component system, NtrC family, sensor kinase
MNTEVKNHYLGYYYFAPVVNRIFLLLIATGLYSSITAQSSNDELHEQRLLRLIATSENDSTKVVNLRELAEYYLGLKTDTSLLLAGEALDLSIKIKYEYGEALSRFTMGKIFVFMGNYSRGLELYLQSLDIYERIKETEWVAIMLTYIGEVYIYQGDYQQSLRYLFRGSTIAEKNEFNITLAKILMNISKAYENLNQLDSASIYIQKSYELVKLYKDDYYLPGKILYSLGGVYSKTGESSKAMEFYRLGMSESYKVGDFAVTCNSSLGIAALFSKQGNKDSSLYYARRSLAIADKADFLLQELNAVNFLAQYYKEKKIFDSAYKYLETAVILKDSLISKEKIREFQRISFSEQFRQMETEKSKAAYRNKVRMLILLGGLSALLVVAIVLWRNIRIKQKANKLLTAQKLEIDKQRDKVEKSFQQLKSAQAQLIQSEKMASLGELTAGIAHEIQNPLNFVNNFSEVSNELLTEMNTAIEKGNHEEAKAIANDVKENLEKISHHGKRAEAIVKGMLQHSRSSSGVKELTNINTLANEYSRLAYHGLKAKDKSFDATMKTDFDQTLEKISIIRQDIGRVIVNLIINAFYAVTEKKNASTLRQAQGSAGQQYEPTVSVSTKKMDDKVLISIKDNGNGIPHKILDKIFQPFFTTKPTGLGTGLGLSLSYDIIKAHGGEIKVVTKEGGGAEFIIELPGM